MQKSFESISTSTLAKVSSIIVAVAFTVQQISGINHPVKHQGPIQNELSLSPFPSGGRWGGFLSAWQPVRSGNIYFHYLTILSANNWPGIPAILAITALTGSKCPNNCRIHCEAARLARGIVEFLTGQSFPSIRSPFRAGVERFRRG